MFLTGGGSAGTFTAGGGGGRSAFSKRESGSPFHPVLGGLLFGRRSEFLRSGKGERRGKGWEGEWEPDAGEGHVWSSSYLCREPSGEIYRNWFHLHTALRLGVRVFGVDAIAERGRGVGNG